MQKDFSNKEAMTRVFKEDPDYLAFYISQIIIDMDFEELLRLCKLLDIELSGLLIKEFYKIVR